MDLAHEFRASNGMKAKWLNSGGIGSDSNTLLVIKLPDWRVLHILSRSLFLAIILLTLPSIGFMLRGSSSSRCESNNMDSDLASLKMLPALFRDLADEGLLSRSQKGLFVCSCPNIVDFVKDLEFLRDNDKNIVVKTNIGNKNLNIPRETFDFVFSLSLKSTDYAADHVLKNGGIVITRLSNDPSSVLQRQPNYRIVYLRRFENTFVAMRKVSNKDGFTSSTTRSTPCEVTQEDRKVALRGLEDALLEPPRRTLLNSSRSEMRKMKFLPDLSGDSLESYKRRILISDEKNGVVEEWFHNNYPTRNQHFEMFNLEINVVKEGSEKLSSSNMMLPQPIGMRDWLRNNVRHEDFVVMKAEAQVVEEVIKDQTICLVDELFLECKNELQDDQAEEVNEGKRAYWQCLALYGRLRDQGIAVHQWWN